MRAASFINSTVKFRRRRRRHQNSF